MDKKMDQTVPDDTLAELASFRRQWQEEVKHKHQQQRVPSESSKSNSSKLVRRPSTSSKAITSSSNEPTVAAEAPSNIVRSDEVPEKDNVENFHRKTVLEPSTALEHYERAVEEETHGSLGESLKFYRKAFKMDPKVDDLYRDKYFPKPKPSASSAAPVIQKAISVPPQEPPILLPTNKLIPSLSSARVLPAVSPVSKNDEEPEYLPSPISHLPHELILQILDKMALKDIPTYARFAQTCKALCFLFYTEDRIWRHVCEKTFQQMCWGPRWKCGLHGGDVEERVLLEQNLEGLDSLSLKDQAPEQESDVDALKRYAGSWRRMFIERPRIRYNGIYISTCTYQRAGYNTGHVTFTAPIHIVTYYRYLRFYPTGVVLSLLTTSEPQEVVHILSLENFNQYRISLQPTSTRKRHHHHDDPQKNQNTNIATLPSSSSAAATSNAESANQNLQTGILPPSTLQQIMKSVLPGRWQLSPTNDGRVYIETEGAGYPNSRNTHEMELWLKMKPKGLGGKGGDVLRWGGYWSYNRVTDDRGEFSLRNDKPFFFSRVKTYEREMGLL